MILSGWPLVSLGLLTACLASFGWAMRHFFSRPAGNTPGMKLISASGMAFAALHLGAIVWTPQVTARQGMAAAFVYLAALGLFWWAIRTSRARPLSAIFSPDEPAHVVEQGPYRYIRHPLYCSYLLAWTAGVVATGRLWLLPSVAVMLVLYLRAARLEEEKFARSPLAANYLLYRSQAGLFFPNPLKLMMTGRPVTKKEADAASLAQYRA